MLPAANSWRCGFQKCVRAFSISVTCALLRLPSLSPRRVASSSPPAPPPTTTTRCSRVGASSSATTSGRLRHRHVSLDRVEHLLGLLAFRFRLVVEDALHALRVELVAPFS